MAYSPAKLERLLFIGNSFTWVNDVPAMVRNLLESDGSGRKVTVELIRTAHLNDAGQDRATLAAIKGGRWDVVLLESAMVSMSHTHDYPQAGGIALGKAALAAKARAVYWVEWSRRGIDETDYTYKVYDRIRKAASAELVPVCYVWDRAVKAEPNYDFWAPDGNHATPEGSYLASCALYCYLTDGQRRRPTWSPREVAPDPAVRLQSLARRVMHERLHPSPPSR